MARAEAIRLIRGSNPPQNLIMEPTGFTNFSAPIGEHLGFPTQKPLGLLKRLIPAACPPNGLVLDPFCGCGTTVVAAHDLRRRWIGIDISATAIDIVQQRRSNLWESMRKRMAFRKILPALAN